jgi:hypothetical protein
MTHPEIRISTHSTHFQRKNNNNNNNRRQLLRSHFTPKTVTPPIEVASCLVSDWSELSSLKERSLNCAEDLEAAPIAAV